MQLTWIERIHPGPANRDSAAPVLVLIHGRGDSPENFIELTSSLPTPRRELALRAPQELDFGFGRGWQWFETSSAQGDTNQLAQDISDAAKLVAQTLDELNKKDSCPQRKFVVAGFSQGGMLTYALALQYPRLLSHALPVAGLLPPAARPEHVDPSTAPPITAFHGLADPLVCPTRDQELVDWLKAKGYPVSFSGYPGVEHTLSPQMHEDFLAALERSLRAS